MVTHYEEHGRGKEIMTLLFGPLLGLAYFICLPFIAIATIVTLVGGKILGGMLSAARSLVSFGWRPTEAYLAGRKRRKKDKN